MVVLSHEFLTWIHTPRSLQTVSGDPVNVKFYPNIMSLYGFCGEEFPQCLLDEQRGLSPQESTRTTAVGQQHRSLSSCIRSTRGSWCLPCARYWGVCRDLQRPSISWGPGMSPSQVDSSHVCTKFTLVPRESLEIPSYSLTGYSWWSGSHCPILSFQVPGQAWYCCCPLEMCCRNLFVFSQLLSPK